MVSPLFTRKYIFFGVYHSSCTHYSAEEPYRNLQCRTLLLHKFLSK
nr:MAG TPA: hypothetical protein [Bacteriophage sp.]